MIKSMIHGVTNSTLNSKSKMNQKKRIAVFFGGRSPEHDVSVVTALQGIDAIDSTRYDVFPVYITPDGRWMVGDDLRSRDNYMIKSGANVQEVTLDVTAGRPGQLIPRKTPFIGRAKPIEFDCAFLAFHGAFGEDGHVQGLFEMAGIPYTGARTMAASVFMDKVVTKRILNDLDIPTLPFAVIPRPREGTIVPEAQVKKLIKGIKFPMILKPVHLGSSIGVAKVNSAEEISACLPAIFEMDDAAMVEPFVQNLVEYNVAVSRVMGETTTSALERPKAQDELLDFKQKYLSGGGSKKMGGAKAPGASSEGMLSLTRELNPKLPKKTESNIRAWAIKMFDTMGGTGAPRIDFIGDSKTGEIWFNEVNPIPGSFGYFLWEAMDDPLLFTDLTTGLIEEAFEQNKGRRFPKDPVPVDARLLKR